MKLSNHRHLFPIMRWRDALPPIMQMFYGAVPIQKQELLYVVGHVIIWTAEKYDEVVEISNYMYIYILISNKNTQSRRKVTKI